MLLTPHRLRLACNLAGFSAPLDKVTGKPPFLWTANDCVVEVALFTGIPSAATLIDDLSNLSSFTLEITARGSGLGGAPLTGTTPNILTTVTTSNTACTFDSWLADSDQQIAVSLTAAQLNQKPGEYWLGLHARTTDDKIITVAAGLITLKASGKDMLSTTLPDPADLLAYSMTEADNRYLPKNATGFRERAGYLELYDDATQSWRPLFVANGTLILGSIDNS